MAKREPSSKNNFKYFQQFFGIFHFEIHNNKKKKNNGILYVHGRDSRFRPIIMLQGFRLDIKKVDFFSRNAQLIFYKKVNIEEIMEAMIYFLVYIIENLMLPGQIENWNYIIDFGHMGVSDLPIQVFVSEF